MGYREKNVIFKRISPKSKCGIAQIAEFHLLRNDESFRESNKYKVIDNIIIEMSNKKHYSNSVKWGVSPTQNILIIMEE